MAAFLQNHRTCFITASPVSPHKAVGMMPVANLFNMLNTDQSSKAIFLNKIFNPGEKGKVPVTDSQKEILYAQIIQPIICAGDAIGAVILIGKSEKDMFGTPEKMLVQTAAGFLGRQMEQ